MRQLFFIFLIIGMIFVAGCSSNQLTGNAAKQLGKPTIMVFKSPDCGCCVGYVSYLESQGFTVDIKMTEDIHSIKEKYGIPSSMESCHTAVVGNYFIEGHVPVEAVNKLLVEKPAVDGIALPRMPAGSPGMPGVKRGQFRIYSLSGGVPSEFTEV